MSRFWEILPGALTWATLLSMPLLAWLFPAAVAIFIILFDLYWFFKTVYLTFHLRTSFLKMKSNLAADWAEKMSRLNWQNIYHLILLPMHSEPYEVVKETMESLAKNNYPKEKFIVVLATEEKGGETAAKTAEKIQSEYADKFFRFLVTNHPAGLAGEIPGKGSNETWAAKAAKKEIIDPLKLPYGNIIVSVFDVDTQVFPDYFNCLTYNFLTCDKPQRSSFQPIPFFTNNIYQAPALARILSYSATFWHMMQQATPEKLVTFSSHSMPFKALVEIGFWQTKIVSEDSRIFWQLFLHYNGDWRVVPLFYPLSMDANAAPTFFKTLSNLYKQQRRWAFGVENVPYLIGEFMKNKIIPRRLKISWTLRQLEGFHSWATNSLIIFALGWLPVLLGGKVFNYTLLSYNLPQITSWIMTFASAGILISAILSIALLPPRQPQWFRPYHKIVYFLQWALLPIVLVFFGCFPAIEAQTRLMLGGKFKLGFWVTPKIR